MLANLFTASIVAELTAILAVAAFALIGLPIEFVPVAAALGLAAGAVSFCRATAAD